MSARRLEALVREVSRQLGREVVAVGEISTPWGRLPVLKFLPPEAPEGERVEVRQRQRAA